MFLLPIALAGSVALAIVYFENCSKEDGCYELLLPEIATGLQRGELLAFQWDDLNFKAGTLRVERQVYRANGEL